MAAHPFDQRLHEELNYFSKIKSPTFKTLEDRIKAATKNDNAVVKKALGQLLGMYVMLRLGLAESSTSKLSQLLLVARKQYPSMTALQPEGTSMITALHARAMQMVSDIRNGKSTLNEAIVDKIKKEPEHNIAMLLIYSEIYKKQLRADILKALEVESTDDAEFTYIEVVDRVHARYDFTTLEKVFADAVPQSVIEELYDASLDEVPSQRAPTAVIDELLQTGLLIPVVDDFLRYHKVGEHTAAESRANMTNNAKIKHLVTKYNKQMELPCHPSAEVERTFFGPMSDRKAVLIDDIEEAKLEARLHKEPELADSFMLMRSYPYHSFSSCGKGVTITPLRPITAVRKISLEHPSQETEWRVLGSSGGTVVGFLIPRYHVFPWCLVKRKLQPSTYKDAITQIKGIITRNDKLPDVLYWKFAQTDDVIMQLQELHQLVYSFGTMLPLRPKDYVVTLNKIYKEIPSVANVTDQLDKIVKLSNPLRLPRVQDTTVDIPVIHLKPSEKSGNTSNRQIHRVCQHHIEWRAIQYARKFETTQYNQKLFEFFKRFVMEDKGYVCRSCHHTLDVGSFVTASYDGNIVLDTGSLEASLETIPEYSKYVRTIKNLDNLIEKICYGVNISTFYGSQPAARGRRQDLIKTVIDMVTVQYSTLFDKDQGKRRQRTLTAAENYGFSKDATIFFLFQMDNELFTFSSQDTDKFKRLKLNNVFLYVIFIILSNINSNNVSSFGYDKLINYLFFDKFAFKLFQGMLIHINDKNDVSPITDYPLLCYAIYHLSSLLIKYKYWYSEEPYASNNIKDYPRLLRLIINSFVDLTNSILQVNTRSDKNYMYEVVSSRFLNKLLNQFNKEKSKDALQSLRQLSSKRMDIVGSKIVFKKNEINVEDIVAKIGPYKFIDQKRYKYAKKITRNPIHVVYPQKALRKEFKLSREDINALYSQFEQSSIKKLLGFYGKKKALKESSSIDELDKQLKKDSYVKPQALNDDIEAPDIQAVDITEAVEFGKMLQGCIGSDAKIGSQQINLLQPTFVVNHDYRGHMINKPLILEKVPIKKGDANFKQDVYYVTDKTSNNIMYYSVVTRSYIGYREGQGNVVFVPNTGCYLQYTPSLPELLVLLGHSSEFYTVSGNEPANDAICENDAVCETAHRIMQLKLRNVRNAILEFKYLLHAIANNGSVSAHPKIASIIKRFKDLHLMTETGIVLYDAYNMTRIPLDAHVSRKLSIIELPSKQKYISAKDVQSVYNTDKMLISYFVREIKSLLAINKSDYNRAMIVLLVSTFLQTYYDKFMETETALHDVSVRRFALMVENGSKDDGGEELTMDEPSAEELEKQTDDQEADEALDMDRDPDDDPDDEGELQDYANDDA